MRRATRGFTLIEVLVAVGILLALAVAMGRFVVDLLASRDRLEQAMSRQREADAVLLAIERALATTVVEDAILGVGVRGAAESLEVVARGVPAWRLGDAATRTLALADRERLVLRGGFGAGAPASLVRGEGRGASSGSIPAVIRFRYHDGDAWLDQFDSVVRGALPRAIEVSLWWVREDEALGEVDLLVEAGEDGMPDAGEAESIEDRGETTGAGVEREDLGGPSRPPDRVRVIPIPDAGGSPAGGSPAGGSPSGVEGEEP